MAQVTDINDTQFDAIIVGSSLPNCILFASLARAGKKVALFEPQQWHGFMNSSLSLADFHRFVKVLRNAEDNRTNGRYMCCDLTDEKTRSPGGRPRRRNFNGGDIEFNDEDQLDEVPAQNLTETLDKHLKRARVQARRIAIMERVYNERKVELAAKKKTKEEEERKVKEAEDELKRIAEEEEKEKKRKEAEEQGLGDDTTDATATTPDADSTHDNKESNDVDSPNDNDCCDDDDDEMMMMKYAQQKQQQYYPDEIEETLIGLQDVSDADFEAELRKALIKKLPYEILTGHFNVQQLAQDFQKSTFSFPIHGANEYIPTSSKPVTEIQLEKDESVDVAVNRDGEKEGTPTTTISPYEELIKKSGYRYVVDLIHQEIYATSLALRSIVDAKIHEYHEFRAVNKTSMLLPQKSENNETSSDPTDAHSPIIYEPSSIPSSKQDIFSDSRLSLRAKHKLSSILLIIQHDKRNAQCTPWHHAMFAAYKTLPVTNLVYHVCNPQYVYDESMSDKAKRATSSLALLSSATSSLTSAFSLTSSLVGSTFTALTSGAGQEEDENKDETQPESDPTTPTSPSLLTAITANQQPIVAPTVEPLVDVHYEDFVDDSDAVIITQLLTSGLVQHLKPAFTHTRSLPTQTTPQSQSNKDSTLTTAQVSVAIGQHLSSIGRYTSSAYLYPMYGIGEISQAWVYNASVWGGFGVVRMALAGIVLPKKGFKLPLVANNTLRLPETTTSNTNPTTITIMTQSGQLINTNALICDRSVAPFDVNQFKSLQSQGLDYSSNEIQVESKDDNLVQPTHIISTTTFMTKPTEVRYCVKTTQHIALIVDKLPPHFNPDNVPLDNISIQTIIIPPSDASDKVLSDVERVKGAGAKIFVTEPSVGMSTNNHFMVSITTNLLSTYVSRTDEIHDEYEKHIEMTRGYLKERDAGEGAQGGLFPAVLAVLPQLAPFFTVEMTQPQPKPVPEVVVVEDKKEEEGSEKDKDAGDNNDKATEKTEQSETATESSAQSETSTAEPIIPTNEPPFVPQPFVATSHIKYIASYCYTTVSESTDIPVAAATPISFSTTHPLNSFSDEKDEVLAHYPNIFITPDLDQTKVSIEDSFILASHQFYAFMNYQQQYFPEKGHKMLRFLMTQKEEIVDTETGQALQPLEDRNPQLAHTIDVIESLEEELARIEATEGAVKSDDGVAKDATTTPTVDSNGANTTTESTPDDAPSPVVADGDDDETAILDALDDLDLGDLEGLDF